MLSDRAFRIKLIVLLENNMFYKTKDNIIFILEKQEKKYVNWTKNKNNYDLIIFDSLSNNKWKDIHAISKKYKKKIKKYKTITFVDSDVNFNGDVADYLDVFQKYDLQYASPSYELSSDFFHSNHCLLRYVNYIPIKFITFSVSAFDSLDEIFIYNETGSGIDWVIPKLLDYEGIALVDQYSIDNSYKEDKDFFVEDLIKIYNEFELSSFYNVEFDRIDYEEIRDPFCNMKLINLRNITKMKFSRPTRRSNGCLEGDVYLSDRMMMSTGGPWMP